MCKILYVFLIFSFQVVYLVAQTPVTLGECRKEALEFNKSMDIARMDVEYAETAIKAARTAYLPKVDGSGSLLYLPDFEGVSFSGFFLPTAESTETAVAGDYSGTSDVYFPGINLGMDDLKIYMAEVSVQQSIYAGGRIRLANKKAERDAEKAREALNLTCSEVIYGTDRAFWSLVAVYEQIEVLKRHVEALDSLESQLSSYYELGLLPKSELLKVTVQRNEARLKLVESNNILVLTSMNLARLTGRPIDSLLVANVNNEIGNLSEKVMKIDFSGRPELKILQLQKEITYLEKSSISGEYMPQIGVNVGYSYFNVPNILSGSWTLTAGAGISIPIIYWREKKHRTDMARINQMKADIKLNDAHDQISMEVQQSRFNLDTGAKKIEIASQNLEQAEETLSEVKISYNTGLNSITDLLNAQAAYQRASATLVESKANLEVLKSAYLKAVGLL